MHRAIIAGKNIGLCNHCRKTAIAGLPVAAYFCHSSKKKPYSHERKILFRFQIFCRYH